MELEIVIGLEIHAQLNTASKLFCGCDNKAFGAAPNTKVCPVCMGFPGVLPVMNQSAVEKSAQVGLALNCTLEAFSKFDRKNYFYPDLPTGYQISQFDKPINSNGFVDIEIEGESLRIGITRAHLENDAGKLTHVDDGSLCDYNRAGTPLIEIVTEPDLRSPEEAQVLAKEIQKIVRFIGASDADMEKGMMRFDASISLRPKGENKFYPRTEIKNLNSFSVLKKALNFELKRQRKLWEKNEAPTSETTVGWLDDENKTVLMRDKESANDYRYFPEPDIAPLTFTEDQVKNFQAQIPELPLAKYNRYQSVFGLSAQEALKFSETVPLSVFFETASEKVKNKRAIAGLISQMLTNAQWEASKITPTHIQDIYELQSQDKISSSAAKEMVIFAMESGDKAEKIMQEKGLEQKSDLGAIDVWVEEVIEANPKVVEEIKNGKEKMVQFLMGQVMKKSNKSANPPLVIKQLKEKLGLS